MSQAIDTLMHEHRVIERVLAALETAARSTAQGGPIDRSRIAQFADFFANFADTCHHGKEEDILFARMVEAGFPREQGPIAVMLADHGAGRQHVGALRALGEAPGPLTSDDREAFVRHAREYVAMLSHHILKEDRVLYPIALQAIPAADMAAMAERFDAFERNVMGPGVHEGFHALADTLIEAYPPAPASSATVGHGCGCHGHA